jgi:nicotinate-nucleotide adenylyltransferase
MHPSEIDRPIPTGYDSAMAVRIGLYGGTFDPVHSGHLIIARAARERLSLDQMILIPSAHPPHKPIECLTEAAHRLAMVRLAVEGETGFEVSDCETRRSGLSYTIDTVAGFRAEVGPDAEIVWLIGSDSLRELAGWHRVEELADACRIVIAARPGWESPDLAPLAARLRPEQIERLRSNVLDTPRIDISATEVRRRVAAGLSIRWLVPDAVAQYVAEHRLYRPR